MGAKLGLLHLGRNIGWQFSRTGCWERSWAQEWRRNREVEKTA